MARRQTNRSNGYSRSGSARRTARRAPVRRSAGSRARAPARRAAPRRAPQQTVRLVIEQAPATFAAGEAMLPQTPQIEKGAKRAKF